MNATAIAVLIGLFWLIQRTYARQVAMAAAWTCRELGLEETVAQRARELSELSRHLLQAAEEEKAKLARDLHDELGARLTSMKLDIAYVAAKLKDGAPALTERLQRAIDTLGDLYELKHRLVDGLRPSLLDHLGLGAALRADGEAFTLRTGVACQLSLPENFNLDPARSIAFYRVVQE